MWHSNSLMARTKQVWKLRTAMLGWLLAPVLMVVPWALDLRSERLSYRIVLLATIVATSGFVLSSIIRCPRCRTSWFWRAMRAKATRNWY